MWLILAFITAFLHGTTSALSKRLLERLDDRVVGWGILLFSLPWLAIGLLAAGGPTLSLRFFLLIAFLVPLELIAYLCYLRSIRISPLSLSVPFLALTPLLTILTSGLLLEERITLLGFSGVAAVVVGAYVLQAELVPQGILEPVKAMFRSPGIRFMLITATIYSVTAPLGKRAMQMCGPAAFPFVYFSIDTLALTALAVRGARGAGGLAPAIRSRLRLFLLAGLVTGGMLLTHCLGIVLAPVAYFLSIKRLGLLVSVLYGGLLFREAALPQRLLGCGLMLAGVALIYLGAG